MKTLLQELKEKADSIKGEIEEKQKISKAYCDVLCSPVSTCEPAPASCYDIKYLESRINDLWSSIDRLWAELYKHEGASHIPAINSVAQMKKVLEVLGLSEEYAISPKQIYASNGQISDWELNIKPISK